MICVVVGIASHLPSARVGLPLFRFLGAPSVRPVLLRRHARRSSWRPAADDSDRSRFVGQRRPEVPLENSIASTSIFVLQATKSQRWMPWRLKPKKDVGGCDKPRGAAYQASIRGYPNGETHRSMTAVLRSEHIGPVEGTRGIETSQYPEERNATPTRGVAESEMGRRYDGPL